MLAKNLILLGNLGIKRNVPQFVHKLQPPSSYQLLHTNQRDYAEAKCIDDPLYGIATYEELRKLHLHPETYLIDVRDPVELRDKGRMLFTINIPLIVLKDTLDECTSNRKFKSFFKRDKPSFTAPLIIASNRGRRSGLGASLVMEMGFKNVRSYKGGYREYVRRNVEE